MNLWLVGAGNHAAAYAKVLKSLGTSFEVIGRGRKSAKNFSNKTKIQVHMGGLKKNLEKRKPPHTAIVAVSFNQLSDAATRLINAGTKKILLEKPGALNLKEIKDLNLLAREKGAKVWIGYNRRFYSSTLTLKKRIQKDRGALSCLFELTEWSRAIANWKVSGLVKEKLFVANSSHVADLAFYLCGKPKEWRGWSKGSMPWHKRGARFSGAGITTKGILFSYHADWQAPGRWGIEVLTKKKRYYLRPLESLAEQALTSQKICKVNFNDSYDKEFKPGLYLQTKAFLEGKQRGLCTLANQTNMMRVYSQMAGYKEE